MHFVKTSKDGLVLVLSETSTTAASSTVADTRIHVSFPWAAAGLRSFPNLNKYVSTRIVFMMIARKMSTKDHTVSKTCLSFTGWFKLNIFFVREIHTQRLSSWVMKSATWVHILDEAVFILDSANTIRKLINTAIPIYQPLCSGRIWHKVNF